MPDTVAENANRPDLPTIVLCYPVQQRHIGQIQAAMPDAPVIDAGQERIAEFLPNADIFIGHAKVPVPWDRVVKAGRLKWIQSSAAGLDHCLVPSVVNSDILLTGAAGLFANQVAEQTMGLILGLIRSLPVFFRAQQSREFIRRPTGDLHGKTIGIVGFGGNGRRIAEVLAPYRVRILANDLLPRECPDHVEAIYPAERLEDLVSESDIVIMCVPLTRQTRDMVNRELLDHFKKDSLLINVARGQVVVEADLVEAILSGRLAGAGLDVTEVEPLGQDSPLWNMENVIITPHVGAQSSRRVDDTTDLACENLRRYRAGKPLLNVVDKLQGF